jgi:hypothetical protein
LSKESTKKEKEAIKKEAKINVVTDGVKRDNSKETHDDYLSDQHLQKLIDESTRMSKQKSECS